MNTNVVVAAFGASKQVRTRALYQWDYGQILQFAGLDLPSTYTVHFSNVGVGGTAKTMLGGEDGVDIPDEYLTTGKTVYAWVYLHAGDADGETVYAVIIPVIARPQPVEEEPTPVQQGLIEQAIAALDAGAEAATEAAAAAAVSAAQAEAQAHAVSYEAQALTDAQKAQALLNIGAGSAAAVAALQSAVDNVFTNSETTEATPSHSYPNDYLYMSSGTMQDHADDGFDSAIIPLSACGDVLTVGFNKNADYPPSGGAACIFAVSDSLGASAPNYYSKSNFVNGHSSMSARGVDNSHIADGYYTIEIAKLKTALPAINAIGIVFPKGSYLLKKTIARETVKVDFLKIAGTVPALVVAADGSGDYTTISGAVAAASDGDTIYIRDGEYKETVVVNKYLHLVGQSKQGTVLYQNIGDYDNAPLCITQGSVCNMTIRSLAPADTSGLTDYAFAIHLDKNFASLAKYQKCEIWNCDIYSEVNDAIGAGTNYASEYDIHDCLLHVAHNPVKSGACGFKCHNGQNQTTGKVTLRNNVIITEDANGTSCYDILYHNGGITNIQPIEVLHVGNVLKYYHNGITNIFVPSAYNYGNSVAAMNEM